jgi:hypothetical protein
MPDFVHRQTGQQLSIDDPDEAQRAFQSGDWGLPNADAVVPMLYPTGDIVGVKATDASQALEGGARFATHAEHRQAYLEEKHGGVVGGLEAGAAGLARGASVGLTDVLARHVAPSLADTLDELKEARPIISGVTNVVGAVAPIVFSGGAAAPEEAAALAGGEALGGVAKLGAGAAEVAAGAAKSAATVEAQTAAVQAAPAVAGAAEGVLSPLKAAAKVAAGYSPPAVISRIGEGVERLVGQLAGPATGSVAKAAVRVAGIAASGAVQGGLYQIADQMDEDALGDHEANAEKLIAAFGHGAFMGSIIGGGFGAAGEILPAIVQRAAPKLQGLTDELALRAHYPTGGRQAELLRKGLDKFEGGPRDAARFVNERGLVVATDTIEQRWQREEAAKSVFGDQIDEAVAKAEQAGAAAPKAADIIETLRDSKSVKDLRLTKELNEHLLGVHPEEVGLSNQQAHALHAISIGASKLPKIDPEEVIDLVSRGLVHEMVVPTSLAKAALQSDVTTAERAILGLVREKGLAGLPEDIDRATVATLQARNLISPQGRITRPGEMALSGMVMDPREREILSRAIMSGGALEGETAEINALMAKGYVRRGFKISDEGKAVAGMTKRGILDKIAENIAANAGEDGRIPISALRKLRVEYNSIAKFKPGEAHPPGAQRLYQTTWHVLEDAMEGSLKDVGKKTGSQIFNEYKAAKEGYAKVNYMAELAKRSAGAKMANRRLGLGAKILAGEALLTGHPAVGAGIVAGHIAMEHGAAAAAQVLRKLTKLTIIERAAKKVDGEIDAAAKNWMSRMSGSKPPIRSGVRLAKGLSAGEERTEEEPGIRAQETISRLHALRANGPITAEHVSEALGGSMEHAPKITGHVASKLNAAAQFVASKVPSAHADYSDIATPRVGARSSYDYQAFGEETKGSVKPLDVIHDFGAGRGVSQPAMKAMKTSSPKMFEQFRATILREMAKDPVAASKIPYQGKMQLAFALNVPTHWSMSPAGMRFLQSDRTTVAAPPNSSMGPKKAIKGDLSSSMSTDIEKAERHSPGRKVM